MRARGGSCGCGGLHREGDGLPASQRARLGSRDGWPGGARSRGWGSGAVTAAEERPADGGGDPVEVLSPLDEVDITSMPRYLQHGYPWAEWDLLRDHAPVYRYEGRARFSPFWAVT